MTQRRKIQLAYIAIDFLTAELVWLAFLLFRWLVYEGKVFSVDTVLIPAFDFYRPLIIYPIGCLVIYYLSGYYLRVHHKRLTHELMTTFISSVVIALGAFFIIIIDDQVENYHRYVASLAVLWLLQFSISYVFRLALTLIIRRHATPPATFTVHSEQDVAALRPNKGDRVIIDPLPSLDENALYRLIRQLYPMDVEIAVVPKLYDMLTGAAKIPEIDANPLVLITEHKMTDSELCIKRAFDIVAASVTIIVLSPLYVLLWILAYSSSKGPAFYSQQRIGLHGKPFAIYKFRTMVQHAEDDVPQLSADDDPRITRVGHFMRRYRLDELPQMWNIIKGDMSIVGPRPEREFFIRQIVEQAPYYCLLYKIRPGMTSWGPIRVGYTDTLQKMIDRLNYDIVYMENMSLRLDIKILFYTIGVILDGKGK
ncbi:MAG: sugar transferase [Paludibacteraceae bacterium]|jgi:exopolysaccharide biosynthesis polyprenyl glycosylphosphotransferase|nr:sugar transferase [Paludibacteraceae bacterium]MBO7455010.1 sugar transferase [Paludibacteraceae bacterium]